MKNLKAICLVVMLAVLVAPLCAYGAKNGPGQVKISAMTRVEYHSKVYDKISDTYGGVSYLYDMFSATRELQKKVLGSIFYLNQYSFKENNSLAHIGGVTLIRLFPKHWVGTFGYTFSSNPVYNNDWICNPDELLCTGDRLSTTFMYTLNPDEKKGPKYSLLTSYNSRTSVNTGRSFSEKLGAKVPLSKKLTGDFGYTFSYSFEKSITENTRIGHTTNQFGADLTYDLNKQTKLVFGGLFINKLIGDVPNDTVLRLTCLYNFK